MSVFFFQRSGDHRALHSFPTRRSSDLGGKNIASRSYLIYRSDNPTTPIATIAWTGAAGYTYTDSTGLANRSEEHTSELQSHSDLVCRLLLEKNKKTTP